MQSPRTDPPAPRDATAALGGVVDVRIETRKGGFVKAGGRAGPGFVSPLPCPFNYGSVPGTVAEDGEPIDALVLGPRLTVGDVCRRSVLGIVSFQDAGQRDDKLVCGTGPELASAASRLSIRAFFVVYAAAKLCLNLWRGRRGRTSFEGLRVFPGKAP